MKCPGETQTVCEFYLNHLVAEGLAELLPSDFTLSGWQVHIGAHNAVACVVLREHEFSRPDKSTVAVIAAMT